MITERDPTREELAKSAKSERWNCVAAALFAITNGALGALEILRGKNQMQFFGYVLIAVAIGYIFVFWRSLRRYRELA